ncbi:scamp family-domain-containing protein [Naematelia encephala]|uniref:Scamp family-domain-containing protein n=1 Tax=Naematelia encephala TaxID=71784 RepID=A0A1Y2AEJ0_9TREE|nr:scamp family-domain-containing protein [Naematelia encephala]
MASHDPFSDPPNNSTPTLPIQGYDSNANPFSSVDSLNDLESGPSSKPTTGGYSYGASPYGQSGGFDPAKQAEYDERERRLNEREAELRARENAVGIYQNNWPPLFPFLHHDISTLPELHQQTAKFLYIQWLALLVTLLINLLGAIFLLVAGASEGGADTGAAGGYLLFISIASFILWYRPIYLGLRKTEGKAMAFFFYAYFLFAGCHLLFSAYMVIGIPSTGSAGLINTISMFSQGHILAGVFGAIASAGWILQAAGGGILYKKIWDYKNGNADISWQEATNQIKTNSIKTIVMHQARM